MRKASNGEKVFDIFNITFMILLVIAMLIPLFSVISTSLVSAQEIASKRFIIFPDKIDFKAYKTLLAGSGIIISGFRITLFRVVVGTALSLTCTYFVAYALTKKDLPGKTLLTMFFFFTMLFNGGLIPYYIVVKSMNLINNIWVYILPGIISVWNLLLIRNFINDIPDSLFESADIDGANDFVIVFRIVLPLSIPALVTIGMFYAVAQWNNWWDAYLFVSKSSKQPLQLILRNILAASEIRMNSISGTLNRDEVMPPSRAVQTAAVVITTIPIAMAYPFIQKYFVKGIMIGAVKQ